MRKLFLAVLAVFPLLARADAYDELSSGCLEANAGKPLAAEFCACLVDEVKKRVPEPDLAAYLRPEPSPSDRRVESLGRESSGVCREKVLGETVL